MRDVAQLSVVTIVDDRIIVLVLYARQAGTGSVKFALASFLLS